MDTTDIIMTAYSYDGGTSTVVRNTDTIITVTNIVLLYNMSDEIVTYYVIFSSNEYAVVNNNTEKSTVIEFREGTQEVH